MVRAEDIRSDRKENEGELKSPLNRQNARVAELQSCKDETLDRRCESVCRHSADLVSDECKRPTQRGIFFFPSKCFVNSYTIRVRSKRKSR